MSMLDHALVSLHHKHRLISEPSDTPDSDHRPLEVTLRVHRLGSAAGGRAGPTATVDPPHAHHHHHHHGPAASVSCPMAVRWRVHDLQEGQLAACRDAVSEAIEQSATLTAEGAHLIVRRNVARKQLAEAVEREGVASISAAERAIGEGSWSVASLQTRGRGPQAPAL